LNFRFTAFSEVVAPASQLCYLVRKTLRWGACRGWRGVSMRRVVLVLATMALEAVREGSNTGKSPQHQATHHRMDHGLATLAQALVVLTHPSAL
jgi:hypothetical protein